MAIFEFRTPHNIPEKARREHSRLTGGINIDNVFNFFVTAYHIQDYIGKTKAASQSALDAFLRDQVLMDPRDLCEKGKHLRLTKRPDPSTARLSSQVMAAIRQLRDYREHFHNPDHAQERYVIGTLA